MTNGELEVKLDNMTMILKEMRDSMVTTQLFNTWRDGNNERLRRLEEEQKEWAKVSTAAHVQLEADSRARHQESEANAEAIKISMESKISHLRTEFNDYKKDVEGVKRGRFNTYLVAALGLASAFILKFFVPDI